jgi:hypothetical protein
MLIGRIYFNDVSLVLRDVDGSEVTMPLYDAMDLAAWLIDHSGELAERIAKAEELSERIREAIARNASMELAPNEIESYIEEDDPYDDTLPPFEETQNT